MKFPRLFFLLIVASLLPIILSVPIPNDEFTDINAPENDSSSASEPHPAIESSNAVNLPVAVDQEPQPTNDEDDENFTIDDDTKLDLPDNEENNNEEEGEKVDEEQKVYGEEVDDDENEQPVVDDDENEQPVVDDDENEQPVVEDQANEEDDEQMEPPVQGEQGEPVQSTQATENNDNKDQPETVGSANNNGNQDQSEEGEGNSNQDSSETPEQSVVNNNDNPESPVNDETLARPSANDEKQTDVNGDEDFSVNEEAKEGQQEDDEDEYEVESEVEDYDEDEETEDEIAADYEETSDNDFVDDDFNPDSGDSVDSGEAITANYASDLPASVPSTDSKKSTATKTSPAMLGLIAFIAVGGVAFYGYKRYRSNAACKHQPLPQMV